MTTFKVFAIIAGIWLAFFDFASGGAVRRGLGDWLWPRSARSVSGFRTGSTCAS
jgi:hypothetical protein